VIVGTSMGLKIELAKTARIASFPIICFAVCGVLEGLNKSDNLGTPLTINKL